jgi:5-methylcytosine-specific restriction endonuclease McrA
VDLYLATRSAKGLRQATFKRDHGRCAGCGRECCVPVTPKEATVRVARRLYTRHGYWRDGADYWREVSSWEADHIVPIADGGSLELGNAQTQCDTCHPPKTAAENSARAAKRRRRTAEESGQMVLDLVASVRLQ